MHNLILVLLLVQSVPQLAKPRTETVPKVSPKQIHLPAAPVSTTTGLSADSALNIGEQLGTQNVTVSDLEQQVGKLQSEREAIDRPDIDGLKTTREHYEWTFGILGTVLVTVGTIIWAFKNIIWKEVVRPRLRREICPDPFGSSK